VTTAEIVARFLATQSPSVEPPEDVAEQWRQVGRELGVPCPEALLQLATAGWPVVIPYAGSEVDNSWFELESPAQARDRHRWNVEHVRTAGMPAVYTEMLPFANSDGAQLLLDASGAVHGVPFTIYARAGRIAASLEDLLVRVMAQPIDDDSLEE